VVAEKLIIHSPYDASFQILSDVSFGVLVQRIQAVVLVVPHIFETRDTFLQVAGISNDASASKEQPGGLARPQLNAAMLGKTFPKEFPLLHP
jgi:hypothetical protein